MAMFKDVLELVQVKYVKDELHQEIKQEEKRQVYCDKKSVSQTEFFSAGQNGFKPQYAFIMRLADYENEQTVIYNNKKYVVYRTYEKGEDIELYCEFKVGA